MTFLSGCPGGLTCSSFVLVAGNYKQDLNRDNPLGMNGEIAENYGALIEKLWSGTSTSVAPRDFKVGPSKQQNLQEPLSFSYL